MSEALQQAMKNAEEALKVLRRITDKRIKDLADSYPAWQDISTAPKDGTEIDVYCANSEFPSRYTGVSFREPTDSEYWVHGSDWPDPKEGTIGVGKYWFCDIGWPLQGDNEPTHWMPLPQPPEERQ